MLSTYSNSGTVFSEFINAIKQNDDISVLSAFASEHPNETNIANRKHPKDGRTPLHIAIDGRHLEAAKVLLEEMGADPSITDNKSRTALHAAAEKKCVTASFIALIVEKSREDSHGQRHTIVDAADNEGKTALHVAIENDNVDIVVCLLNNFEARDDVDGSTTTVLHVAVLAHCGLGSGASALRALEVSSSSRQAQRREEGAHIDAAHHDGGNGDHGAPDLIRLLVANRSVNIDALDHKGRTALHGLLQAFIGFASTYEDDEEMDEDDDTAAAAAATDTGSLMSRVIASVLNTVYILLAEFGVSTHFVDTTEEGSTVLHKLAQCSQFSSVFLLPRYASLIAANSLGKDFKGTQEHVQRDLVHQRDKENNEVALSAFFQFFSAGEELFYHEFDFKTRSESLLTLVRLFVEELGFDVYSTFDTPSKEGLNILHAACACVEVTPEILRVLVLGGGENTPSGQVVPPSLSQQERCRRSLLANQQDVKGRTPLHYLAQRTTTVDFDRIDFEMIRMLVEDFGADPNICNTGGHTVLHTAAIFSPHFTVEVARFLVEKGHAAIDVVSHDGESILQVLLEHFSHSLTPNDVAFDEDDDANLDEVDDAALEQHESRILALARLFIEEYGLDVANHVDKRGHNTLHYAVLSRYGGTALHRLLMDQGGLCVHHCPAAVSKAAAKVSNSGDGGVARKRPAVLESPLDLASSLYESDAEPFRVLKGEWGSQF